MVDPNNSSIYWSGGILVGMRVSKTTNSGSSWVRYSLNGSGFTFSLAVDPTNSNIVYAGGVPGLYKTTNGGSNWFSSSTGITDTIFDIEIDPTNSSILYAGTPDGVFRSTNSGVTWINTGCAGVKAVAIDYTASDTLYVGTNTGVYLSTTGGGSWVAMNSGLDNTSVISLEIDPGHYLFAGTEGSSIYRWNLNVGVAEERRMEEKIPLTIYPNPIRDQATITYYISKTTVVELSIFDVQGRLVKNIVSGTQQPGTYTTYWTGRDDCNQSVSAGIYFCKLSAGEMAVIDKTVLLQ